MEEPTEATTYEQILLACHTITWLAARAECVRIQLGFVARHDEEAGLKRAGGSLESVLSIARDRLNETMQGLGDAMNHMDTVGDVDELVTTPAYKLVVPSEPYKPF